MRLDVLFFADLNPFLAPERVSVTLGRFQGLLIAHWLVACIGATGSGSTAPLHFAIRVSFCVAFEFIKTIVNWELLQVETGAVWIQSGAAVAVNAEWIRVTGIAIARF